MVNFAIRLKSRYPHLSLETFSIDFAAIFKLNLLNWTNFMLIWLWLLLCISSWLLPSLIYHQVILLLKRPPTHFCHFCWKDYSPHEWKEVYTKCQVKYMYVHVHCNSNWKSTFWFHPIWVKFQSTWFNYFIMFYCFLIFKTEQLVYK